MAANNAWRNASVLILAGLLFLSGSPALGDRKHRPPVQKRPTKEAEAAKPKTEEKTEEAEDVNRFPLYLAWGEEAQAKDYSGPAVPPVEEFMRLFDLVHLLEADPWIRWDVEARPAALQGKEPLDTGLRENRLRYLAEKAGLFDELLRLASETSAMAGSLAEAGEWSLADSTILKTEELRLRVYREEIEDQMTRLKRALPTAGSGPPRLRRQCTLPEIGKDAPEPLRLLVQDAGSLNDKRKIYENDILPALEKVIQDVEDAYSSGDVGFSTLARCRGSFSIAKGEYLDLLWKYGVLLENVKEATGKEVSCTESVP
jgi:hypothetical protein